MNFDQIFFFYFFSFAEATKICKNIIIFRMKITILVISMRISCCCFFVNKIQLADQPPISNRGHLSNMSHTQIVCKNSLCFRFWWIHYPADK